MQDRYTGDVGDFGKYGLLRWLCGLREPGPHGLRLGVIWYRTGAAVVARDPANDGKHIGYLSPGREDAYRPCDPPLYDGLRDIVRRGERRVEAIVRSRLLGRDTRSYDNVVPAPTGGARGVARMIPRRRWFAGALSATRSCDLLFLDPDNGLEAPSAPITSARAGKYAYLDELEELAGGGRSVLVYHHLARNGTHARQIARWSHRLQGAVRARGAPRPQVRSRIGPGLLPPGRGRARPAAAVPRGGAARLALAPALHARDLSGSRRRGPRLARGP